MDIDEREPDAWEQIPPHIRALFPSSSPPPQSPQPGKRPRSEVSGEDDTASVPPPADASSTPSNTQGPIVPQRILDIVGDWDDRAPPSAPSTGSLFGISEDTFKRRLDAAAAGDFPVPCAMAWLAGDRGERTRRCVGRLTRQVLDGSALQQLAGDPILRQWTACDSAAMLLIHASHPAGLDPRAVTAGVGTQSDRCLTGHCDVAFSIYEAIEMVETETAEIGSANHGLEMAHLARTLLHVAAIEQHVYDSRHFRVYPRSDERPHWENLLHSDTAAVNGYLVLQMMIDYLYDAACEVFFLDRNDGLSHDEMTWQLDRLAAKGDSLAVDDCSLAIKATVHCTSTLLAINEEALLLELARAGGEGMAAFAQTILDRCDHLRGALTPELAMSVRLIRLGVNILLQYTPLHRQRGDVHHLVTLQRLDRALETTLTRSPS